MVNHNMKKTYEHEYQYEFMDINQYYYINFNNICPLIYKISAREIWHYDEVFYNLTFNQVHNIYHISGYNIKIQRNLIKIPYHYLTFDFIKSTILKKYPLLCEHNIIVDNVPYLKFIPFITRKMIIYPSYQFETAKEIKFKVTNYILFEKKQNNLY